MSGKGNRGQLIVWAVATLALLAGVTWPESNAWPRQSLLAAGLTIAAISFWATAALPMGVSAVGFLLLAVLFKVQPLDVVFSGFHTGATWLVFGGLVIGVAISHTGLGDRLARAVVGRLGSSYLGVLAAIGATALILSFLLPSSMGRVILLVPIVVAIAERLGMGPGSPGRTGMVMVACLTIFSSGGTIMSAHIPSVIMVGVAENLYDLSIGYGEFLLVNLPILGVLRTTLIVVAAWRLFPASLGESPLREETSGPMGVKEKRLAAILLAALMLWATDGLHHLGPAWIAMGAGLILLLPRTGLVPAKTINERLDYGTFFYTAAVLGMGAIIAGTGLNQAVGRALLEALPAGGGPLTGYLALTLGTTPLGLIVTNPGLPVVVSPLAADLAQLTGLPLKTVLMTQVYAFTNVILPYQASPIVVGIAMAGLRMGDAIRMTLVTTLVTLILLVPLQFLWWLVLDLL